MTQRIECLVSETRVSSIGVNPRGTPEHVPPVVRTIGEAQGAMFRCIARDLTGDANFIAARNILTKILAAL